MKRTCLYVLCALSVLLPSFAQEERVTEITSEKLFFDYEGKQAIFTGNVVVNDPDLQLTGDKLTVFLTEDDDIERLLAEGNVEIRMEGMQSRSGKAVYTPSDGKVLLTERPQVSRDGSVLQAEKITYWRLENRLEAFPRARVIMFQEEE